MKVSQLIQLLEECDQDATVRIMMQPHWPFECAIDGVAVRSDFDDFECVCADEEGDEWDGECRCAPKGLDGGEENDVFIVEGNQERYGNKNAWNDYRRPW